MRLSDAAILKGHVVVLTFLKKQLYLDDDEEEEAVVLSCQYRPGCFYKIPTQIKD